jgi:hypothetical protein
MSRQANTGMTLTQAANFPVATVHAKFNMISHI